MNATRSTTSAIRSGPLILAALLSSGCGEELGPVAMPVTRVRGVVKQGDRPVSDGWIEFIPVEGTLGNLRSARLGPDGGFDARGVAVGRNAIRLVNARMASARVSQIFSTFSTPIRREIAEDPRAPLKVDLIEEAVRFEEQRRQLRLAAPPVTGERP
jgi:hypothetical protein